VWTVRQRRLTFKKKRVLCEGGLREANRAAISCVGTVDGDLGRGKSPGTIRTVTMVPVHWSFCVSLSPRTRRFGPGETCEPSQSLRFLTYTKYK
jgi:hypothetical protein